MVAFGGDRGSCLIWSFSLRFRLWWPSAGVAHSGGFGVLPVFWGSGLLWDQPVRGAGYEPSGILRDIQESQ